MGAVTDCPECGWPHDEGQVACVYPGRCVCGRPYRFHMGLVVTADGSPRHPCAETGCASYRYERRRGAADRRAWVGDQTYYDTLEEDLARAKQIVAVGTGQYPIEQIAGPPLIITTGTIVGADTYAAYQLLKSFVGVIERHRTLTTTSPGTVLPETGGDTCGKT